MHSFHNPRLRAVSLDCRDDEDPLLLLILEKVVHHHTSSHWNLSVHGNPMVTNWNYGPATRLPKKSKISIGPNEGCKIRHFLQINSYMRRFGEYIKSFWQGACRGRSIQDAATISHCFNLLLNPPPFLFKFWSFHWGSPSPGSFPWFCIRIQHPPRGFPSSFILYPHEPIMKAQIVTDWVL